MRFLRIGRSALLLACLVFAAVSARADGFAGRWDMRADGATIWRFVITLDPYGNWTGAWIGPTHFQSDGFVFENVEGPTKTSAIKVARQEGDALVLSFESDDAGEPVSFRFREAGGDRLLARMEGAPFPPFLLERAHDADPPGPWTPGRTYRRTIWYPTNAEMTALFEADQAARAGPGAIDWAKLGEDDRARRLRTQELLDAGELRSGDDFYHAAFIFQHGDEPADFIKAHILATIAIARGRSGATWIAAAALDRYLQAIGRKQIFGTQYALPPGEEATQEPYDRTLLSDALRNAMGVPGRGVQEARRRELSDRDRDRSSP